jgi:hypothetical protein
MSLHARSPSNGSNEAFVYPGSSVENEEEFRYPGATDGGDEEDFLYPGASDNSAAVEQLPERTAAQPSPAQLEALYSSAASGNLPLLQQLFRKFMSEYQIEAFVLANDAGPRTGLTALHGAASRGHLSVVRWRARTLICYTFVYSACDSC